MLFVDDGAYTYDHQNSRGKKIEEWKLISNDCYFYFEIKLNYWMGSWKWSSLNWWDNSIHILIELSWCVVDGIAVVPFSSCETVHTDDRGWKENNYEF